jgi:Ca-activated chloride channel family protein
MIVSFDYQINVLSPLTSDASQLKRAVDSAEIPPRGEIGTVLRDVVYETVERTFVNLKGRKAIILLTDGKDSGSSIRTDALLYKLQESDTLIYPVMFSTGPLQFGRLNADRFSRIFDRDGRFRGMDVPNPRQQQRIEQAMNRIGRQNELAREMLVGMSDATAGRFYSSEDGKLKKTFASIVEELRFQYRLGYYSPEETASSQLHQIRVKITRPDAVVRARTSYRASSK